MRELVLNELSLRDNTATIYELRPIWGDISRAIASLVREGICGKLLRMPKTWDQYAYKDKQTLYDLILMAIRERGHDLDEYRFLLSLSSKVPITTDLGMEIVHRLSGCEAEVIDGMDGECLLICALLCGVSVSVPLEAIFDKDVLAIRFQEILDSGEIKQLAADVDNVGRQTHAYAIAQRHRSSVISSITLDSLWQKRQEAFPYLSFGRDVPRQLGEVERKAESAVIHKLAELNDTARRWKTETANIPDWRSEVTPESASVMQNHYLRECRRFPSCHGDTRIYEWHAKTAGQRIHLNFDVQTREIEIGYIGKHLPLP